VNLDFVYFLFGLVVLQKAKELPLSVPLGM
jgi:hypothetical protein